LINLNRLDEMLDEVEAAIARRTQMLRTRLARENLKQPNEESQTKQICNRQ